VPLLAFSGGVVGTVGGPTDGTASTDGTATTAFPLAMGQG
jgi:hypothetical protein